MLRNYFNIILRQVYCLLSETETVCQKPA